MLWIMFMYEYKIIYVNCNLTYLIKQFRPLNHNLLILCWVCIEFANRLITILSFFTWNGDELFYVQDYISRIY